jgi:hypothetical protein
MAKQESHWTKCRTVFTETLRGWFNQLRRLQPPNVYAISVFMGAGILSCRISHPLEVGPFASQEEFHAKHFCQSWAPYDDELRMALEKRAKKQCACALIDWDCAGCMPEYWEHTRALYVAERYLGWERLFTDIFPDYHEELIHS